MVSFVMYDFFYWKLDVIISFAAAFCVFDKFAILLEHCVIYPFLHLGNRSVRKEEFFVRGLAIARASFLRNQVYLLNHVAANIGSFVFGYIFVCIWKAVLGDSPEASTMITYVMVNQSALWVTMFLPRGAFLIRKVYDGTIVFDLIRPYGLMYQSFFEVLGHIVYNFVFRSLPIYLLGVTLLGVKFPDVGKIIPYMVSVFNAFVISFFMNYFVGLWMIKFLNYTAAQGMYYFFMNLFGGYFLPAQYYPAFLRKIMPLLPFASTNYIPGSVYLGKIDPIKAFGIQWFWILMLGFTAFGLTELIKKEIRIQGG
jgi:ABC-2 type transport system permease protein